MPLRARTPLLFSLFLTFVACGGQPAPVKPKPAASAATATAPTQAIAPTPSPIRCRVRQQTQVVYEGACAFHPDGPGGSFEVKPTDPGDMGGANSVSVSIVDAGFAEVRGLTDEGINARWGEAKQSTVESGCWDGDDFQVCVWGAPEHIAP